MTNWGHVKNDMARSLLEGREPASNTNVSIVLNAMLEEHWEDSVDRILPFEVLWGRADALDEAHDAYEEGDIALCMNRIKTFYLT